MKKIFVVSALGFISLFVSAQSHVDVFTASYQLSPSGFTGVTGMTRYIADITTAVKAPLKLKNEDVMLLGINGSRSILPSAVHSSLLYGSAGLQLGYIRKWNEKLNTQFILLPKFNSSIEKPSDKAMQLGGVVLFTKAQNEKLRLKYGVYCNRECFGAFIVPLLGFDFKPSERWQLYGVLPMNATAVCRINDHFTAGANFTGIITSYAISKSRYLQKASNELCLFADAYINKHLVIQPRAGYSVGRSYRTYASGDKIDIGISALKIGDDRVKLDDEIHDGVLLQLSLIYRVAVK